MLVISIITILISIGSQNYIKGVTRAKNTRLKMQLKTLRNAIYIYYSEHNGTFPKNLNILSPKYINRLNLKWETTNANGTIDYNPKNGQVYLKITKGNYFDIEGKPYSEY